MLSGSDQERARQALDEAREAALSDNPDRIRTALEHLENIARLITDAMFRPTSMAHDPDAKADDPVMPLSELS